MLDTLYRMIKAGYSYNEIYKSDSDNELQFVYEKRYRRSCFLCVSINVISFGTVWESLDSIF